MKFFPRSYRHDYPYPNQTVMSQFEVFLIHYNLQIIIGEIKYSCKTLKICNTVYQLKYFKISDHFNRKTSQSCPVDCESLQYTTALSYGRFLSNPPTGTGLARNNRSTAYISKLKETMDSKTLRKYIE